MFLFQENVIIIKVLPNALKQRFVPTPTRVLSFATLAYQLRHEHNFRHDHEPLLAEATYTLQPGEMLLIASRMPHLKE